MKNKYSLLSVLLITLAILLFVGIDRVSARAIEPQVEGTILYVKPGANGTCTSWADACELQTAFSDAVVGDQIWVAAGTYKPTTSTNRSATFQLKSGVAVYGGFPAVGGEWIERDCATNLTTLSGDIGKVGDNSDNSYHVVIGSAVGGTSILDGFTITGGNANGTTPNAEGGGMYVSNGSPTLANLSFAGNTAVTNGGGLYNNASDTTLTNITFSNNSAANGGGIYNRISNPTLTGVTFSTNSASISGGGMMNSDSSNPTLSSVNFVGNSAVGDANYQGGGGMANFGSNPTLTNVTFTSNTVMSGGGGGIFNKSSSPKLTNSIFNGNSSSHDGGGMCNIYYSSPILTDVTFLENTASYGGGGLANLSQSNPIIKSTTFVANQAGNGGGVTNYYASPSFINVTFSENLAGAGAGLFNIYDCNPTLTNVTFSGNSATDRGGGIYSEFTSTSTTQVTNSILWGNTPEQISGDSAMVTYSDIQGGYPGEGNFSMNPLLGALADHGGVTQTHALNTGSPAIDAANPETCPTYDQRYYVRPIDGDGDGTAICDMGAYEYGSTEDGFTLITNVEGSGTVTVDPQKTGYRYGEAVTLTATPISGWSFAGWGDAGTTNPLTVTITGNTSITATFTQDEYTLTIGVDPEGAGSVAISPEQVTYHYGDEVTLTATAIPGWSFAGWSGDATGSTNPLSLTIEGNTSITATFIQDEYTLTVTPVGSGAVAIDPVQTTYHYGDQVTLTATADPGWSFSGWSGDATGSTNPLTVTIAGDTSITATFTQDEYTLTTAVDPLGSGSVQIDQAGPYHYGDEVTLTATANAGWDFVSWSGDASGIESPLVITIHGDTNITANFTDHYALIVEINPSGFGTVTLDPKQESYQYGTQVTLTPIPNPGWYFLGWSGDVTATDNPLVITVEGETNITANFVQFEFIYLPMILKN